jgi:hypothetical protein
VKKRDKERMRAGKEREQEKREGAGKERDKERMRAGKE